MLSLAALLVALAGPAAAARAQVSLPPIPPIGGTPAPPGERPPPEQPAPPPPVSRAPGSVTGEVDVAHSGHFPDDALVPPLVRRWAVAAKPVEVLAADGRVYVLEQAGVSARDQGDGHVLWRATLPDRAIGAAYDGGRLFVSSFDDLHAFDAATGAALWTQHLTNAAFAGRPVASGGFAYVTHAQGGSVLHAYRGSDGAEVWKSTSPDGSDAPALDDTRAYLGGACGEVTAINRSNGARAWHRPTGCTGGAFVTPALHAGRLWVPAYEVSSGNPDRDPPIFDAASGTVVGRFKGSLPVFVDGLAVYRTSERMTAVDLASGRERWRVNGFVGPVLAVGHDVYFVQERRAVVLDAETGRTIVSSKLAGTTEDAATAELAAAPGWLFSAQRGRLEAYTSALTPAPRGVAFDVYANEVVAGRKAVGVGVLGTELRGDRPRVTIERAPWHGGRFGRALRVRPTRDGGFEGAVRLAVNSRLRATGAGVRSRPVTVYAWPQVSIGRGVAVGRRGVRLPVVASAPARRLGGRTIVLYYDRHSTKGLRLLASGRLRGGRRARAVVRFDEPRGSSSRDNVWWCIRGQLSLGMGRPEPLTRRCGARRLPEPSG
jgi:outer membrane protein assembly factor BamB